MAPSRASPGPRAAAHTRGPGRRGEHIHVGVGVERRSRRAGFRRFPVARSVDRPPAGVGGGEEVEAQSARTCLSKPALTAQRRHRREPERRRAAPGSTPAVLGPGGRRGTEAPAPVVEGAEEPDVGVAVGPTTAAGPARPPGVSPASAAAALEGEHPDAEADAEDRRHDDGRRRRPSRSSALEGAGDGEELVEGQGAAPQGHDDGWRVSTSGSTHSSSPRSGLRRRVDPPDGDHGVGRGRAEGSSRRPPVSTNGEPPGHRAPCSGRWRPRLPKAPGWRGEAERGRGEGARSRAPAAGPPPAAVAAGASAQPAGTARPATATRPPPGQVGLAHAARDEQVEALAVDGDPCPSSLR